MITTDPRAIPVSIIDTLRNLVGWIPEFSDDRLEDISGTLAGVRQDDPAAFLIGHYRQEVLTEIDRRKPRSSLREFDLVGIQPPKPWPEPGKP